MPQRVEALRDARRPVGGIGEFRRACRTRRVTGGADRLVDLLAGLVDARRVGVANVDLGERLDAGGDFGVGETVGAGAGAGRIVDVDR